MSLFSVVITFYILYSCAYCEEAAHHKHRHSRNHAAEYDLERLMNRLDSQLPSTAQTTPEPVISDKSDDFKEPVTKSSLEPANSLWGDDSAGETSTSSALDISRWEKILKVKADKDKQQEDNEDVEDEFEERSEEEVIEDPHEQADSYKPWNSRSGETYTSYKWNQMGNRKSVDSLFQVYQSGPLSKADANNKEAVAQMEVYKHNKQMMKDTQCRAPKPRVIRVSDIYPSSNKLYVPSCTVLHQCGADTGCCSVSAQRCGPKTTNRVELYFYTTYIVNTNSRQRTSSGLEKLPFYNHTECECMDRLEELMPRDGNGGDVRTERNSEPGCKCPSEYTVRRLANGSCTCDCFDKQRDCIKYKKGKEYFNHNDRLCIEMGTCKQPSCDFGVYLRSSGRCPRKHEKFRTWSRYH